MATSCTGVAQQGAAAFQEGWVLGIRHKIRAALAAMTVFGTSLGVIAGATPASAAAVVLPSPTRYSSDAVSEAFFEIISANTWSKEELCLRIGQAYETHDFKSSVPDGYFVCDAALTSVSKEATKELVSKLADYYAQAASDDGFDTYLYPFLRQLVDVSSSLTPCGASWMYQTLLASGFPRYMIFPGSSAPESFAACSDRESSSPTPAPAPPAPPSTGGDDGGDAPDAVRTSWHRNAVRDRLAQLAPDLSLSDVGRATDACVQAEVSAVTADVMPNWRYPCRDEAVFFPGADAGWAAINDQRGIAANPSWARLTYVSGTDKASSAYGSVSRAWYDRKNGAADSPATLACGDDRANRGVECDEFPFYTTIEGGPGALLMAVPTAQNQAEGRALGAMYRNPDCVMQTDYAGQNTYPGSGSTPFFVVPVAVSDSLDDTDDATKFATVFSGPDSFHICGGNNGGGDLG